ncbi:MAG: PQQ-binding-like beta-propeller repeat protein [Planctomycetes bacterium]|nr:PQQ-binding-like beta-propeller repeat protein [Planctomycetota bacterium]
MLLWLALSAVASGGDWPQILGPARNGAAAADERLADAWPEAGPRQVWKRDVGAGVAGVAVVRSRTFLFHRIGDREVLEAIDATTGETLWRDGHATSFVPQVGGSDGPLCAPVVHDGKVVVFGAQGVLACIDAGSGRRLWERLTHRDYDAQEGYFGAGSTPLVVAGRVIVNVGGRKGDAGIVAFDLATGETLWTATREAASYSAPVVVTVGGVEQVLVVTRLSCLLLDPADGSVRWSFPFGQRGPTVNAASPVLLGDAEFLVTASYGIGSICASFDARGVTPRWQAADTLASQYATPVLFAGSLYAIDGRDDVPPASVVCLDPATGKVRWREEGFGYGTLLVADGKIIIVKTDGELLLVRPDASRLDVLARSRPLAGDVRGGPLRALPALANGRLILRNDHTLVALDLSR